MMTTTDETNKNDATIKNIRGALADIATALMQNQSPHGPRYTPAELAEIEAIRASLEARLQEAEAGQP